LDVKINSLFILIYVLFDALKRVHNEPMIVTK